MIWAGIDENTVEVIDVETDNDGPITVQEGEEVIFDVTGLGNDVYVTISGDVDGTSVFHVSCSDQDMNDTGDCDILQGNGKDKKKKTAKKKKNGDSSNYINLWLLEGMVDSTSILDCTP